MTQNLSLYHIFYEVAKEQNISNAAKTLYISQPAVSKAVSKLEESMDTKLFLRNSRGVILTEEGKTLFEHTKVAFEALERGENQLKRMQDLNIGHIRIGVSTTLCKYLLLPYLQRFVIDYPHINITIECQSTNHTLKMLEENQIDIGLIGQAKTVKNIDFYPITKIEDIFVTTKSYISNLKIRENKDDIDIFSLANIMLLDKENITRQYTDYYLNQNKIEPAHLLEVSSLDLLIEFAKTGLGVACVIKNFVQEELDNNTLIELPLEIPIKKREVGFAFSNRLPLSHSVESFIQFYKEI
ncbi:MAG: LysR family transcriptional regulator [Clostridiales bacterium]|nr:LysR family transcriptional regulator [Clostridiales bacterium]